LNSTFLKGAPNLARVHSLRLGTMPSLLLCQCYGHPHHHVEEYNVTPLAYPMAEESTFRTVHPAETCGHDPDEPDDWSVGSVTLASTASSESNSSMVLGFCRPASSSGSGSGSTEITGKWEPTSRVAKLALNYQSKPITHGRLFQTVPPNHGQSEGSEKGHSSKAGKREFSSGEKIEYFSEKVHSWILATVMGRNTNGTYQLDCRRYASVSKMRSVTHTPPPPTPVAAKVSALRRRWWVPKATSIFKSGEFVEYYSRTRGGWVNSMVLGKNLDGTYRLDCKRKAPVKDLRPQAPNGGAFQTKILDHSSFQTRAPEGAFSTRVDILGSVARH